MNSCESRSGVWNVEKIVDGVWKVERGGNTVQNVTTIGDSEGVWNVWRIIDSVERCGDGLRNIGGGNNMWNVERVVDGVWNIERGDDSVRNVLEIVMVYGVFEGFLIEYVMYRTLLMV